jgi:hypothetical protein
LIADYRRQMLRPFPLPNSIADMPSDEEIREEYRSRIPFYELIMANMEYMIRNRIVTQEDLLAAFAYSEFVPNWRNRLALDWFMGNPCRGCIPRTVQFEEYSKSFQNGRVKRTLLEIGKEEYAVCRTRARDFIDNVVPLVFTLPTNYPEEMKTVCAKKQIVWLLRSRYYEHVSIEERLARVETLLTRDMPHDSGLDVDIFRAVQSRTTAFRNIWREASEEGKDADAVVQNDPWYRFLTRLANAPHENTQFYGRAAKAKIDLTVWEQKWRLARLEFQPEARKRGLQLVSQYGPVVAEKNPALLEELAALEEEQRELGTLGKERNWLPLRGGYRVLSLSDIATIRRTQIERPVPRKEQPPHPVRPQRQLTDAHWPRFQFTEPIDYVVQTLDGQKRPVIDKYWPRLHHRWDRNYRWSINTKYYPVVGWRKCTQALDVLYSDWAILVMKTKGLAEEIHSDQDAHYLDVRFDGENLWVVTKNKGVWIMSTEGKILKTIGESNGPALFSISTAHGTLAGRVIPPPRLTRGIERLRHPSAPRDAAILRRARPFRSIAYYSSQQRMARQRPA